MFQESGLPECQESCRQKLEELKRVQEEQMQISIRENEEKMQRFEQKYREKRQKLTRECEEVLARLQEQNETQMALMVAKHIEQEERAARKAEELETEMEVSNNQPAVPQCPVSFSLSYAVLGLAIIVLMPQVCLEEMAPPTRIFQCRNGHLLCETCKYVNVSRLAVSKQMHP